MNKKMVSAILCAASLTGLAVPVSAAGKQENMFVNPGFEEPVDKGWYCRLLPDYIRVTDNPHSGEYCMKSVKDYNNEMHCQDFALTPGETYDLSFWARVENGYSEVKLTYGIRYPYTVMDEKVEGTNTKNSVMEETVTITNKWTEVKTSFTYDGKDKYGRELTPDHTVQFNMRCLAAASLKTPVYYDDFKLVAHGDVEPNTERWPEEYSWDEDPLPKQKEFAEKEFNDISENWAEDSIKALAGENIINGTSDTTYEPEKNMTRAEFVTLLINLLKIKRDDVESGYSDVSSDKWYANVISIAKDIGLIPEKLVAHNRFLPDKAITRGEVCGIIEAYAKATNAESTNERKSFADEGAFGIWKEEVVAASAYGVVNGYPDSTFGADRTITRAEIAQVIMNIAELSGRRYFYVDANDGSDDNDGRKNAPFKTIGRARKAVREVNSDMKGNIYIFLKSGNHVLDKTLTLDADDSGTNGFNIIYTSYGDGNATIAGSASKVLDWSLYDEEKGIYRASVGAVNTRSMYVNGVRAVRAKSSGALERYSVNLNSEYQAMTTSKWLLDLTNIEDAELVHNGTYYTNHRIFVGGLKEDGDYVKIKFNDKFPNSGRYSNIYLNLNLWIENAYELIDEEGEWYLNRKDGFLYYKPRQWENLETAEITLPTSEGLIEGSGSITDDKYEPIHNISFKDIDFAYTTVWNLFQQNGGLAIQQNAMIYGPMQGGQQSSGNKILPAAVKLENVSYIDFEGCSFKKIGGMALAILGGIQHVDIDGNEFYDISGNGVQIGMPKSAEVIGASLRHVQNDFFPLDKRYYKADIQITNNYIHDTAVEFVSAGAMAVTNLQYSNISHNEIFRTSYSGIHAAFGFSLKPSNLYFNTHIEHNYIHKTNMLKYNMEDGGGIYYMGTTHGDMRDAYTLEGRNRTSYNYMEDMGCSVNNIYLDEGTSWIEISHNVFDTQKPFWPFGQITTSNQGKYNVVTDNYLSADSVTVQSKKQEPFTEWYEEYVANGSRMKDEDIGRPDSTTIGPHYILEGEMENWDQGALDIIRNAGLTEEYLSEFPEEFQDFKIVANSDGAYDSDPQRLSYDPAVYDVSAGDVFSIEFEATNRKKVKAEIAPDRVFIDNHTPEVVDVLPDNSIKALKFGKAELTVQVLCGRNKDVVETYPVEVYVDDEVAPRSFSDAPTIWINGTPGLVKVRTGEVNELQVNYFETKLGRKLLPHKMKLSTADESVGVIDEEGRFVGVGDGTTDLIIDMVWGASNKRGTFAREVKSLTNEMYEDFDKSQIVEMGDDFFNFDNWTYIKEDATNIREKFEDGGIGLASPQIMIYNKEKFNNKLLHFKMKLNHTGGWPSFAISNQDTVTHLQNEYILTFYQGSLEWQRYSNGQRYVLWGQSNMWDGVFPIYGGRPAANIEYGKEYDVGIGAFDVPEGVRVVMYIDGIKAFDQIDYVTNKQFNIENQPVLSGGGYFGIHSTSGRMELYKAASAAE